MSDFISKANYSLKSLLIEALKTRPQNDVVLNANYSNYSRPCGYELLIQDNIAAAGMGPSPGRPATPSFCYGTSSGADCEFTDINGNTIQCEVKTKGGGKATGQGPYSNYAGQAVYDDALKAWNAFKNTPDHEDIWVKWITESLAGSVGKHTLTVLPPLVPVVGPSGSPVIDSKTKKPKMKRAKSVTPTTQLAKQCVQECIQYVDANFVKTGVSNLKLPYMISAASMSKSKLGYTGTSMNMGAYKQAGTQSVASHVQSGYAGVAYIQIEEHGLFTMQAKDPNDPTGIKHDPLQFGVPVASFSVNPTEFSWKRPGSGKSKFNFNCGVSGLNNLFYVAEKGGATSTNTSTYSLDDPSDCTALAAIAKKAGTI